MSDQKCPDCNGTGTYVGFASSSKCETCGGSGNVAGKSASVPPSRYSVDPNMCAPTGFMRGMAAAANARQSTAVEINAMENAISAALGGCRVRIDILNSRENHSRRSVEFNISGEVFPLLLQPRP